MSEFKLIQRAQRGDEQALRELMERHAPPLARQVRGRLSPAIRRKLSDSDVMQEAWTIAWQHLPEFEYRGEGSFGRWLSAIVRNASKKAVQKHFATAKRSVKAEVTQAGSLHAVVPIGVGPTPSREAMAQELRAKISDALEELGSDHRAVIELLQHRRVTIAEASELMGRSPNAVKKLHARALAELANRIGVKGRHTDGPR